MRSNKSSPPDKVKSIKILKEGGVIDGKDLYNFQ
jgi:hypothetical protein